ncbi:MAG: hypothetical protein WBD47_10910 [Phormidesmis sp.]
MNQRLVESIAQIVLAMSAEERQLLESKLSANEDLDLTAEPTADTTANPKTVSSADQTPVRAASAHQRLHQGPQFFQSAEMPDTSRREDRANRPLRRHDLQPLEMMQAPRTPLSQLPAEWWATPASEMSDGNHQNGSHQNGSHQNGKTASSDADDGVDHSDDRLEEAFFDTVLSLQRSRQSSQHSNAS